ncbi:hypothetical protein B0O99DRAFT_556691 [Bisporella sp. PMI_857]|nr:hypothetical protein B0O99DRAFT_556691 [Bisporella sp. PMI_857]
MPVTTRPSPQTVGINNDGTVSTADALLKRTAKAWSTPDLSRWTRTNKIRGLETRPVLQTSFDTSFGHSAVVPYANGLVNGIMRAFNQDLHLVLRPDDLWLAILTQFNFFVNGNAEELRSTFVAHGGKKQLELDIRPFSIFSANLGTLAQAMTGLIQENVKDPGLRDWIMPKFSTTTNEDSSVAAIIMMSTFQKYFEYVMTGGCGFPSVTLLGDKADWEEIRARIWKLATFHKETAEWARLLSPTIEHMIATFEEPEAPYVKEFWMHAAYKAGEQGSGRGHVTVSGWLTAFCFWDEDGKRIIGYSEDELREDTWDATLEERKPFVLGGIKFPMINPNQIPNSVATVPVVVKDYEEMKIYETTMAAGLVGMALSNNGTKVQPKNGWWMLQDSLERLKE